MTQLTFFALLTLTHRCLGFPTGSPVTVCIYPVPHHDIHPQTTESPATFTVSNTSYTPGGVISVEINSHVTVAGLGIGAHRTNGDMDEPVGSFINLSGALQAASCLGGSKNFLTHTNVTRTLGLRHFTFDWIAPAEGAGPIVFTCTVVHNFSTIWVNVKSDVIYGIGDQGFDINNVSASRKIDFNRNVCGVTKGCILHPPDCWGDNCDMAVSYQADHDRVHFEMMAKEVGVITVGFSNDRRMGKDETMGCINDITSVLIRRGYNPALFDSQQLNVNITNKSASFIDGRIYCTFSRPVVMTAYDFRFPNNHVPLEVDLRSDFYILIALGPPLVGLPLVGKHNKPPFISRKKVNLQQVAVHYGDLINSLGGEMTTTTKQPSRAPATVFYCFSVMIATLMIFHWKMYLTD